jgi:hypothetical protein
MPSPRGHPETWHDDNGHSHCRASLLGPSLTIPLVDGRLTLGAWQQLVLIDFDTRPRRREIVVQVVNRDARTDQAPGPGGGVPCEYPHRPVVGSLRASHAYRRWAVRGERRRSERF